MRLYRRGSEFVYEVLFPDTDGTLLNKGPLDMQVYHYVSGEKVLLDESTVSPDVDNLYKYEVADTSGFPTGGNIVVFVMSVPEQRRESVYVLTEAGEFSDLALPQVNVRFTE